MNAALIHRTIRELANAVSRLEAGARPRDDGDTDALHATLAGNIDALTAEL